MAYIMIIDDDPDFADAVKTVLSGDGHEVTVATQSTQGYNEIEKRCPDLLILDVMFPEDDAEGFNLARKIKSDDRFKELPIIMLTAVNQRFPLGFNTSDINEEWLPVNDFIEKPVDFNLLKDKVKDLLNKKENTE